MSQTLASPIHDPYYSRNVGEWEAGERVDPVVYNQQKNDPQLEHYERDGFLATSNLFTREEAANYLAEANRLATQAQLGDSDVIIEPHSQAVRTIFRVHRTNALFQSLCQDERLLDLVRTILGGDVYIHQSRINFKLPFVGQEFFWHSDFETWHIEDGMPRMRAVSVSISLNENHEFNGPLMLVRGSHRYYIRCVGETPENHFQQSLRKQEYGVPSREALEFLVEQGEITAPKGPPGSVVLFDCNTMHGSVRNLSPTPRTNLFVVFNSLENAVGEPFGDRPPRPEFLAEREIIPVEELPVPPAT